MPADAHEDDETGMYGGLGRGGEEVPERRILIVFRGWNYIDVRLIEVSFIFKLGSCANFS